MSTEPTRTLVVWCDDWPVVASGPTGGHPVAVIRANRVVAVEPRARTDGIEVGMRRREAQRRCPHVELRERDVDREARAFETVVGVLDQITPRLEISIPGSVRFPVRGPTRYFGGEADVARRVRAVVERVMWEPMVEAGIGIGVGVADGAFAAGLAARRSARLRVSARGAVADVIIEPGATGSFLAPIGIGALAETGDEVPPSLATERRELIDVLSRLGIRRLGDLARLEAADVSARFGPVGLDAHRLASGRDLQPLAMADPPLDLEVGVEPDPPLERVDQAAFVAKSLADRFIAGLSSRGLAARCVAVSAELADGRCIERRWRHEGALSATAIAQRVRWQLDGWLTDRERFGQDRLDERSGAIVRLSLGPVDVGPDRGHQQGFWGGDDGVADRVVQSMARVQAILGADAVRVAEWRGGRAPGEQYQLVPLDTVDLSSPVTGGPEPWPGRLVGAEPSLVWTTPQGVVVLDDGDRPVRVDGRGAASGQPVSVVGPGPSRRVVTAWAGPWVTDERWWDPVAHRRRARFQVQLDDDTVHLVTLEAGGWVIEATWD